MARRRGKKAKSAILQDFIFEQVFLAILGTLVAVLIRLIVGPLSWKIWLFSAAAPPIVFIMLIFVLPVLQVLPGILGFAKALKRDYDVYAILGDPNATPVWQWEQWNRVAPLLDPLIDVARGRAAVKATQHIGEHPRTRDYLRFGALGWNGKSHQKWVHGSPANHGESQEWTFINAEVWAPSWTQCEREDSMPDVYFAIGNVDRGRRGERLLVRQVIVLAVAADLPASVLEQVHAAAMAIAQIVEAPVRAHQRRPWGIPDGRFLVSYRYLVDSLVTIGMLLKQGWGSRESLNMDILEGEWSPF